MTKKIKPAEQTKELNRAKWEFIKRNTDELKKLEELLEKNEKKRDELSSYLASFFTEDVDPKSKAAWDFLLKYGLKAVDRDFAEYLEKETISPAANPVFEWVECVMELGCDYEAMKPGSNDPFKMDSEELKKKVIELYCRDAKRIFEELTDKRPNCHLLLGIDLTRNKNVILEEVAKLVTDYQARLRSNEMKKSRLKWLPKVPELLEVWDLYDRAGQQPAKRTFRQIAKKVGRSLSTVKSQWYMAYEKIFGKAYDPEIKYTTEEKKALADAFCAKCPHDAICYRDGDWFPCKDHLYIAGKERQTPNILEFKDEIYK